MNSIEPYIYSRSSGLNWYHYLHIHGGAGHGKNMGGEHRFVLTYLTPTQAAEVGEISLDRYCVDAEIPYGAGNTIEAAHLDFQEAFRINPIK